MKGIEPFSIYQPQGYHAHPLECVPCARLSLLSALAYAPLTLVQSIEVAAWLFVRMPRHKAKEKPRCGSSTTRFRDYSQEISIALDLRTERILPCPFHPSNLFSINLLDLTSKSRYLRIHL